MKKVLMGALLVGALASLGTAQAAPGNGCAVVGQGPDAGHECTYVAKGAATYAAATPNTWNIYVIRVINGVDTKVILASGELGPPSSGPVASLAGETVHVFIDEDCAGPACGNLGIVVAGESS